MLFALFLVAALAIGFFFGWRLRGALVMDIPVELSSIKMEFGSPERSNPYVEPLSAVDLYNAYRKATGGVSAVTGAQLPDFDACPVAVQKAWEAVAELVNGRPDRRVALFDDLIDTVRVHLELHADDMSPADFGAWMGELRELLDERGELAAGAEA